MAENENENENENEILRGEDSSGDLSQSHVTHAHNSPVLPLLPFQHPSSNRQGSHSSLPSFVSFVSEADSDTPILPREGLGISGSRLSLKRVPRSPVFPQVSHSPYSTPLLDSPDTPGSAKSWQRLLPSYSSYGDGLETLGEEDITKQGPEMYSRDLRLSLGDGGQGGNGEGKLLGNMSDDGGSCPSKYDIHVKRWHWLAFSQLILSIYSTIWSGLWLVLSIWRPRYGKVIRTGGTFSPATASIVFALFAKTIELSFVTVFVTFVGQVLSRRSLVKSSRGVTIAEMSMRTWVIQPGFMITHWQNLRHTGITFMGLITLVGAISAMLYTTASDGIVSPQLKMGNWHHQIMKGLVKTSYANAGFLGLSCQSITNAPKDEIDNDNCLALEHAGQAYHNFLGYTAAWSDLVASGANISTDLEERPQVVSMLFDNTTANGLWVNLDTSNVTANYEQYGRVINNISMSMPHSGVFAAAKDEVNGIIQPEDLDGLGQYSVIGSVVSPTINVLCVNMNATELAPLIYVEWPYAEIESSNIPDQKVAPTGWVDYVDGLSVSDYLNSTVVDDVFEWGANYSRHPPVFPMYPIDFNTLLYVATKVDSDSVYILLKSDLTTDYTMCQLRSYLSPDCSTEYNVTGTASGSLSADCSENNTHAYKNSLSGDELTRQNNYRDVLSQWAFALSLNTGITNANASTSRLLSQLIVPTPNITLGQTKAELNTTTPSLSEALAALASCTLLLSGQWASFYHYWDNISQILDPGFYQPFNASIASTEYTSGPTQPWQNVFYIILALVFFTNIFCLFYLGIRSGLVTDFTEPQNLFALAVNSPMSRRLEGSCGAGPEGKQLGVNWHVKQDERNHHYYIQEGGVVDEGETIATGSEAATPGLEGGGLTPGRYSEGGGPSPRDFQNEDGGEFELRRRGDIRSLGEHSLAGSRKSSYSKLSVSRGSSWL